MIVKPAGNNAMSPIMTEMGIAMIVSID